MSANRYNWSAAFVAFCQGHPLEEIAEALDIPEPALRAKRTDEKWDGLRDKLPLITTSLTAVPNDQGQRNPFSTTLGVVPRPEQAELERQRKLAVLTRNRQINFDMAAKLRNHVAKVIEELEAGKLDIEHIIIEGAGKEKRAVVVKTKPTMQELVALATYAKMVQDMTYKALGDTAASDRPGQDNPLNTAPPPPPITIIMPGAIAEPREKRAAAAALRAQGHKVVDVQAEVSKVAELVESQPVPDILEPTDPTTGRCPLCDGSEAHDEQCPHYAPPST